MTKPFENSTATILLRERIRDLQSRKTQSQIAREANFPNANFISILKSGGSTLRLLASAKGDRSDHARLGSGVVVSVLDAHGMSGFSAALRDRWRVSHSFSPGKPTSAPV